MVMLSHLIARSTAAAGVFRHAGANTRRMLSSGVFEEAQKKLKTLKEEPDVDVKLKLYALFKQATKGDVEGSRPGMMDFAGRAKFDAWAAIKGISKDDAGGKYAALVNELLAAEGAASTAAPTASVEGLAPVNGLSVSIEDKIFKIRLDRPTKFNALTLDMYKGIIAALKASDARKDTSVTVITGSGAYFCSGNDLTNFAAAAGADRATMAKIASEAAVVLQEYVQAYVDHGKPLLGLINGPAVGISVTVLPLFDLVVAVDNSTFYAPFSALGQSPEGCSSYTFPLLLGPARASEFLLLSRRFTAQEALDRGLVNHVVPQAAWERESWNLAVAASKLPPESLRVNKKLLRDVHRAQLTAVNDRECKVIQERWLSEECAAAIRNFLSKSKK